MSWFEQLKMIPSDKNTLAFVIVNAAQTAKAVEEIKNLRTEPQTLKNLLRQVDAGTIDLQQLKDLYGQPPYGDQTIEQMQENIQKLKAAADFMTIDDVRKLIKEALEAKNSTDKVAGQAKVDEILEQIDQNANLGTRTLRNNRDIRDGLDILREKSGQSVIMFKNPPSNKQLLADFAEAIGGELKEGSILTNLRDESQLIALMVPKRSKKTKEVIDDAPTLQRKEKVKETYNKIMRTDDGSKTNTEMLFISGSESVEVDDLVRQKKIFVATGEKMEIVEPFSGPSVIKYIRSVDKVTGSVRAFRPKKFPNGATFAGVIFLDKSSNNSMNINPFVKIILTNDFPTDWAEPFFNAVRAQEFLTEEQAIKTIIEEIYQAIIKGERETERGFNISSFIGANGIKDIGSKSRKKITAEIRKIIQDSQRLEDKVIADILDRQNEQLSFLEGNFTIKEATAYIDYLENEEFLEQGEDYKVTWEKDGFDVSDDNVPVKDKQGNHKRDESGQLMFQSVDGKEYANYAVIERLDEKTGEFIKISPEQAYKEGVRGTSADDSVDISSQIETLRQEVLNMKDFEAYLLSMGKKLKDTGGLIGLVDSLENKASALETITPERSLGFFSQVDELVGNEEVRESFKTIDDNPDSSEAKKAAEELNKNMPKIIENIKTQTIEAFKNQLEKFVKNPASFPDNQVILAKKQFTKNNLIQEQQGG